VAAVRGSWARAALVRGARELAAAEQTVPEQERRCAGVWEAWSKRVGGTRTKRRWGEARGVAAREQKRTGVAACGCGTDALDASGPEQAMACRTRASAAGARPGRRRAARSEQ
jgi:hypothetical protein